MARPSAAKNTITSCAGDGLAVWLDEEMQKYPKLALCGDYNIAPDDRDVHDPRPGPAAFFAPNPSAPPSSASSDWA
jgi:hypothetical protein